MPTPQRRTRSAEAAPPARRRRAAPVEEAPPVRKRRAAPESVEEPAGRDVTVYATKEPTAFHKAFAKWIVTEVGYRPSQAESLKAAFLAGVSIATAARPAFNDSEWLDTWREENGVAKRGRPKNKVEPEPVEEEDDDFEESDEADDDADDDAEFEDDDEADDSDDDDFDEPAPAPVKRTRPAAKAAPAKTQGRRAAPTKAAPAKAATRRAKPADDDFAF